MKKSVLLMAVVICFGLAGCATTPIPTDQALEAPDKRIHNKQVVTPKAGAGVVIVKRDSGVLGSPCYTKIFVNGNLAAELSTSEKVTFYLPEGKHIVSAWPNDPCAGSMAEIEANVTKSRPLLFRVGYGTNGDFFIAPTAF